MKGKLSINGEPMGEAKFDFNLLADAGTYTGSGENVKMPTLPEILEFIAKIEARKFYVWKGDRQTQVYCKVAEHPRPRLLLSNLLADDQAFVMAGMGIIAGAKAYGNILNQLFALEWSDEFIDPQEQIKKLEGGEDEDISL